MAVLDTKQTVTSIVVAVSTACVIWICATLVDVDKRTAVIASQVEENNKHIKQNQASINTLLNHTLRQQALNDHNSITNFKAGK
jgi:hypothetical protein